MPSILDVVCTPSWKIRTYLRTEVSELVYLLQKKLVFYRYSGIGAKRRAKVVDPALTTSARASIDQLTSNVRPGRGNLGWDHTHENSLFIWSERVSGREIYRESHLEKVSHLRSIFDREIDQMVP
jgi:hypothetical protein